MSTDAKKTHKLEFDSKGFFIINVDVRKKKIVVEHYLNAMKGKVLASGKLNKIIEGDDAEEICHTILREGLVGDLQHALYLGRELQKAEIALKENRRYEQDEYVEEKR